ncbi:MULTISPECIES: hypothetical protein [Streptomyces]|uniref:hypothetical protein n=1 Tax=Streptomyces TaxID=1883 RepID=UPI0029B45BE2|nr:MULTISPECIES: hypothetical protein [Streptomyces]MDX2618596.1 hypothetical protein [Streptomyces sp. WI03-5b]
MADLKNIALTLDAERMADSLAENLPVTDRMDLARLGFAYALKNELPVERGVDFGPRRGSNYSVAGIDPGGRMAAVVAVFYRDQDVVKEPYRVIETLMNKGLLLLGQHLSEGLIGNVSDVMSDEGP